LATRGISTRTFSGRLGIKPVFKDHAKKTMTPYFERALKLKEITAWVCSGEILSMAVADFLKENKIDIPGKLSHCLFLNFPI
jgi:DNA-binding LacI/PurR family transcriptional regulator